MNKTEENLKPQYGENQQITNGNYDLSLAVKCINGTFVGKKTDKIITYKGIPFVGQQPVGSLRWKAPVDVTPSDGVYEAYHFAKLSVQDISISSHQGEDCLYLNIWKTEDATTEKKPVMVLDELDIHPAKESEVKIVDWERTYFLTNYYML
ncbi:MAG: carboxylesterase family protein [Prevotella sp.]|nr:carboxylesterase family protein [Prevotella sp.]